MATQSKFGFLARGNAIDVTWWPAANLYQEGVSYMEV